MNVISKLWDSCSRSCCCCCCLRCQRRRKRVCHRGVTCDVRSGGTGGGDRLSWDDGGFGKKRGAGDERLLLEDYWSCRNTGRLSGRDPAMAAVLAARLRQQSVIVLGGRPAHAEIPIYYKGWFSRREFEIFGRRRAFLALDRATFPRSVPLGRGGRAGQEVASCKIRRQEPLVYKGSKRHR